MKVVEVHLLQNVAPANLNRDDTGSPKSAMFGGYRRARVSSQSQKRAVREAFPSHLPMDNLGVRTKLLVPTIIEKLSRMGHEVEQLKALVPDAIEAIFKPKKGKKIVDSEGKTTYLLFLGDQEINDLAEILHERYADLESGKYAEISKEVESKGMLDGGKAVDVALFGRMLADRADLNVDAAAQVAHAISTHKVDREFDFYTAVDDLSPKEETGAGMMGDVEFYSATLYRYANVNLEKLVENLQGDSELALRGIRAFLQSFVDTLPSGKQNTFAAHNPPDFVVVTVREGGPRNLANAFAKPVWRGREGLITSSVAALDSYMGKIERAYGGSKTSAHFLNLSDAKPSHAGKEHPSLDDLLSAVMRDVEELLEAM